MRSTFAILAALGLAACSVPVPDSGQGVGFQDYDSYMANRQAALAQPLSSSVIQPSAGFSTSGAAAAIANAQGGGTGGAVSGGSTNPLAPRSLQQQAAMLGGASVPAPAQFSPQPQPVPLAAPLTIDGNAGRVIGADTTSAQRPRGNAPLGITETFSEMDAVGGVSDEQDFEAVAARETIESDRARIDRNRALYQIDQPGALPQRTGSVGPSIVEYALATQHPVGVKLFQRSPIRFKRIEVACAPYTNADLAQEAFLAAGGPNRDRLGMDPDGDGFACGWDPSPYRAVVP